MKINILLWSMYFEYNVSQTMVTGFVPNLKLFAY